MLSTEYPVSEMFYSLQGEGFFTGVPAFFIRLAGCNLSCEWCDTDYETHEIKSVAEILTDIKNNIPHKNGALTHGMVSSGKLFIVLTGGEPSIHNLKPLLMGLHGIRQMICPMIDIFIAVETNGTRMKYLSDLKRQGLLHWITLSPKAGITYADLQCFDAADELKIVLDGEAVPNAYKDLCCSAKLNDRLYIQPCSEDYKPAVDFVLNHPEWRLSIQTQKIMKIK